MYFPASSESTLRVDDAQDAVCVVVLGSREQYEFVVPAQVFEELFEVRPQVHLQLGQGRIPS